MDDDRLAYIINLIRHRVPEATEDDLAALAEPGLPVEEIMAVLDAMMLKFDTMAERMDMLAARVEKADA